MGKNESAGARSRENRREVRSSDVKGLAGCAGVSLVIALGDGRGGSMVASGDDEAEEAEGQQRGRQPFFRLRMPFS